MKRSLTTIVCGICLAGAALADDGLIDKTESAIERGAEATAHGVKRGVEAAGHGIKRGAEATGRALDKVAEKVNPSSGS